MAGRAGKKPHARVDGAALGIRSAVVKPADAGERHRAGAHRAWLERHIKIAAIEPLIAERPGRGADREQFGMRGRIMVTDGAVARLGDDLAISHHDAADRNLAGGLRGTRLRQRRVHESR